MQVSQPDAKEHVRQEIHKLIRELEPTLANVELKGDFNIVEDLSLDSVHVLEVFANISQLFDLQLDDNLAENLVNVQTLDDLVNIISTRMKQ